MQNRIFIHATNVHQGGGRSLLEALLKSLPDKAEFALTLDNRMPIPVNMAHNVQVTHIKPSIVRRLRAELKLAQRVAVEDIVLCFGNLPPLFKLHGHTVVFVQNRYLIENVKLNGFPLRVRLRLVMERLWLSCKMTNASEFVVQTPAMKRLLEIKTQGRVPVRVLPFVAEPSSYSRSMPHPKIQQEYHRDAAAIAPLQSFVYVASGEPHKNHRHLIEAWRLLAGEGMFPSLCLTLDERRFATLCAEIEEMRQRYGLKITNADELSHQDILALYKKADALIYPSTFESFGLPLIEARQAGLPILAAELDYVRDVLDPEQTFDAESPISIARAVKRFIGSNEKALPLLDAKQFLQQVIGKAI